MPVVKGERAARPTAVAPEPVVAPPVQARTPGQIKTSVEPRAPEALTAKLEKPVPALQAHGFQAGIDTFNQRVQSVHDSYQAAYGVAPSPGLTFDLAKSPVDAKDFGRMFTVPQSQFAAKNRGAINAHPEDQLHVRADGLLVKPSPPGLPAADTVTKLHGEFPTVQMGMLPIPGGDKISGAFAAIGAVAGNLKVTSGGMTLRQAQDVQKQASQGLPVDPAQKALSENVLRSGNAAATVGHSLTTVQQAQGELNKAMGTKLPVTGFFNDDWLKALSNWMKTRDYFQRAATQQASNAGFKDYGTYLKAWKAKQHAVTHNGAAQFFLNALPLHVFSDGGNPLEVLKHLSTDALLLSNPQFSPSYPLHALTQSAGTALAVVGGTVSQAKAYAQAGAAFAKTVDDTRLQKGGTNYDLAVAKAKEALVANPSWLHIFAPSTVDSKDSRIQKLDQITNIAGDVLLLRKPAFTGERVRAGADATRSAYLNAAGGYAFGYVKDGKLGRAAALLEGGPGAEQFVGKAAKLVQKGQLSQEQFMQHLAELYRTGSTELPATSGEVVLSGVHGGPIRGRSVYLAHDPSVAERYGTASTYTYKAKNPLVIRTADEFRAIDAQARGFAKNAKNGQTHIAEWARSQGYDAVVISKDARLASGADGFGETIALNPSEVKTADAAAMEHTDALLAGSIGGRTITVQGPVLSSLRATHLPTSSVTKMGVKNWVRDRADSWDTGLRQSSIPGTSKAADFTSFLRSEFSHASPTGATRGYFDPRLPERVHDFVLRHFKDAGLANKVESDLIRARATENIPRIQKINQRLQEMYYKKYSVGEGAPINDDPFQAMLESESASRFRFPGGNQKPVNNPFDRIAQRAKGITQTLNAVSAKHRLIILSGFPLNLVPVVGKAVAGRSLFWKHLVGDSARRFVGGDTIIGTGLKDTHAEIGKLIDGDPALARRYGAFLDRSTNSETRYLTANGEQTVPEFTTSAQFKNKSYMRGAGGYVRRMLDDKALTAYRASTAQDQKPLVDLLLHDKTYIRLWKGTGGTAEDYAATIFNRYHELEAATTAANTSLDDALTALRGHRGAHADDALGKWIAGNRVDFTVKQAKVELGTSFDQATSGYIKQVMVFNKLNRGGMAKNVTAGNYRDLVASGMEPKVALSVAMDVAEKQVVYHMLDFANMLQAEQDLRWLSYFATKHRLYWKWVLGTIVRNPGSAAVIQDARQHLDPNGNLNFTVAGVKLAVPAARLFWIPGKEYSEVAPTTLFALGFIKGGLSVQAGINAAAGTFGNVIGRSDTSLQLIAKASAMQAGKMPATYTAAAKDLPASLQSKLNREINHYQQAYLADHGHYAPEADAVKHVLWKLGAEEGWRANLPLPVVLQSSNNDTQKLLDQFMRLSDPTKKSAFLDAHPELAASFGVSKNPADYQHYRTYWSQYTQALDQMHAVRQHIFEQAQKGGYTAELDQQRRDASTQFQKLFTKLKNQDLAQTDPARVKEVNGERLGLWGQQISADPLVDPNKAITTLIPSIDQKQLQAAVPTQMVTDAKTELRLLSDPAWVAKTFQDPSEAKTRRRELLGFIDDYKSFPHDALGRLQTKYLNDHVNTYWTHVEDAYKKIALLGRGDKDLAYAKLRAWKDTQDKPVMVDGVRFPSPIGMAWASLPPDEKKKRAAAIAQGSWDHLSDYEKRVIGVETPKGMSAAWLDYQESIAAYRDKYPGAKLDASQKQFLVKAENKQHPGFIKDWLFAQQPTIDRLERTQLFQEMPADARQAWNKEIAPSAKQVAKALKSGNYDNPAVRKAWKDYVHTDVPAFLEKNPVLKRWLQPFIAANPDFFTSLPVR